MDALLISLREAYRAVCFICVSLKTGLHSAGTFLKQPFMPINRPYKDTHFPGLVIMLIVVLTLAVCLVKPRSNVVPRHHQLGLSKSLPAVLSFITPTAVAWPVEYTIILDHSTSVGSNIINIQLSTLLANIYSGVIELRNERDLSLLFRHRLQVYGWTMVLNVGLSWRLYIIRWVFLSQMSRITYPTTIPVSICNALPEIVKVENCDAIRSGSLDSSIHLDYVAYADIKTTIRAIQHHLQPGKSATFELTTIAPNVSFLSSQFILCSLPFMPRKHFVGNKVLPRTSTPLLVSLHQIAELLTSGSSTTTIKNITNVTVERVETLRFLERKATTDQVLRSRLVEKWGLDGWREHRFMTIWEAGLLSAGYLSRWIITIEK